jgi:predicted ATPase
MAAGPRAKRKGYFLRAETAFGLAETVSGMYGYWPEDLSEYSHGEGFLTIFEAMFRQPGLYLMDEPEAALSFTSCLRLVALMHELGNSGAQVICATHSPILAARRHRWPLLRTTCRAPHQGHSDAATRPRTLWLPMPTASSR